MVNITAPEDVSEGRSLTSLTPRLGVNIVPFLGHVENRWPHKLAVKTEVVCSPVSAAPKLRDVAPEIAMRYRKRFRNGSHWKLDDSEYKRLAEIVRSAGTPVG
jgi:hypothetical protein